MIDCLISDLRCPSQEIPTRHARASGSLHPALRPIPADGGLAGRGCFSGRPPVFTSGSSGWIRVRCSSLVSEAQRLRCATRPELITRRVRHADTPILLKHALSLVTGIGTWNGGDRNAVWPAQVCCRPNLELGLISRVDVLDSLGLARQLWCDHHVLGFRNFCQRCRLLQTRRALPSSHNSRTTARTARNCGKLLSCDP
jgi:hypothetical protein